MTWFTLSLGAVVALAVAELAQQNILNKNNAFTEKTSAVLTFIFEILLTLPIIFIWHLEGQLGDIFQRETFIQLLIVSWLSSLAMIFYLKSFRVKNISLSVVFLSFSMVVSTTLGIIFFSETVGWIKFSGIALILTAIMVLNLKCLLLEKRHWFGLLAGIFFGIIFTLDKNILFHIHPLIYLFWSSLMIVVWSLIFGFKEIRQSLKQKHFLDYKLIGYSGLGYFLYNLFIFNAYKMGGEVGKIDAIDSTDVFLIILFEYFILKHTQGISRKIIAGLLAVGGIYLLSLN